MPVSRLQDCPSGPPRGTAPGTTVRPVTTPPGPPPLPERAADQPGSPPASGPPGYGPLPGYGSPPGYGPPESQGAPGYGTAPPYGYGQPPGYPQYQPGPKPGTDGFAIAAFVLSIIGGVLLSVVFGFVALSRIKRSGQGGRGLAIAALVISAVWVVVLAVLVAIAVAAGPARDTGGAVTKPTSLDVGDLKTGDCLVAIPADTSDVSDVDVTPCTNAHRAEVFATFDLPSGDYPGLTQARQLADDGCSERTPTISTTAGGKLDLYYVYPQKASWSLGDRSVTCFVATSTPVTSKIVP